MSETKNQSSVQPEEETLPNEEPAAEENTPKEEEPSKEELLKGELDALNDKYLRILAEYDNFRKRSQKEKDGIYPRATADTVEKFLPIIDNFERAMACECSDATFKKGMDMIFQSFLQTLKELNVEMIGEEGETFDPELHNAVMHIDDESYKENEIVQVLQKGYRIGDRVVRYAMVKVAN